MTKLYRKDGSPNLFTGGNNEVWSFGEETYEILKKYMNIREKIRPYTRKLMRQAHEKGTPVMRTMFYEFPDDETCWELKDQYMFGSDLLIAPIVYENMTSRKVYLPKGAVWTNLHDGKQYEGGQFVLVDAPLDVIPVFSKNERRSEWIGII